MDGTCSWDGYKKNGPDDLYQFDYHVGGSSVTVSHNLIGSFVFKYLSSEDTLTVTIRNKDFIYYREGGKKLVSDVRAKKPDTLPDYSHDWEVKLGDDGYWYAYSSSVESKEYVYLSSKKIENSCYKYFSSTKSWEYDENLSQKEYSFDVSALNGVWFSSEAVLGSSFNSRIALIIRNAKYDLVSEEDLYGYQKHKNPVYYCELSFDYIVESEDGVLKKEGTYSKTDSVGGTSLGSYHLGYDICLDVDLNDALYLRHYVGSSYGLGGWWSEEYKLFK